MRTHVIIPIKDLRAIKSRLSLEMSLMGRQELALCMLKDVLSSVKASYSVDECVIVSPDTRVLNLGKKRGVATLKEDQSRGVNEAVNRAQEYCISEGAQCIIIFPGDIPLLSPVDIDMISKIGEKSNTVVVAPSIRLDGTNALLCNPPGIIKFQYEHDSFYSHIRVAKKKGLGITIALSRRVMLDIDTRDDVKDFLSVRSDTLTYDFLHRLFG